MAKLERFRRLCAHTSVCLLAALSLVQTVNAEACAAGGRINFLLGPSEGFTLQRAGESLQAKPYLSLCSGDVLSLLSDAAKASVQLGRNKFEMLQGPLVFTVPEAGDKPGKEYGLMQVAGNAIFKQDVRLSRRAQSRSGSDVTINFPCLSQESKCALLAATERPLGIQWSGGTEPYRVKIGDCGIKTLYKATTHDALFQTPSLDLTAGKRYCISIKDAAGIKRRVQFSAELQETLPELSDYSQDPWLVEEQRATLEAMELLNFGPEWAFEAYQRLIPFIASHPPAASLAQGIANGEINFQEASKLKP
jgi:hypothetical protein